MSLCSFSENESNGHLWLYWMKLQKSSVGFWKMKWANCVIVISQFISESLTRTYNLWTPISMYLSKSDIHKGKKIRFIFLYPLTYVFYKDFWKLYSIVYGEVIITLINGKNPKQISLLPFQHKCSYKAIVDSLRAIFQFTKSKGRSPSWLLNSTTPFDTSKITCLSGIINSIQI